MTINRAHGQTMDRVGVYLPKLVFFHGQLYALSRTGNPHRVSVLIPGTEHADADGVSVRNVVWREVFDNLRELGEEPSDYNVGSSLCLSSVVLSRALPVPLLHVTCVFLPLLL